MKKLTYLFITLFLFINLSCQKEIEKEGYVDVGANGLLPPQCHPIGSHCRTPALTFRYFFLEL